MTAKDGNRNTRTIVDWEKAKLLYRIGTRSNKEIAAIVGTTETTLLKYAKAHNWQKDLTGRYSTALKSRLASDYKPKEIEGRNSLPSNTEFLKIEEETIQAMAEAAAQVIREHKKGLQRLRRISDTLTERVEAHLAGQAVTVVDEQGNTVEAPFMSGKESVSDVVEKISRVQSRIQGLERVAFSLDEKKQQDPITVVMSPDEADV